MRKKFQLKHVIFYIIISLVIFSTISAFSEFLHFKYLEDRSNFGHYHFSYSAENINNPLDVDGYTWGVKVIDGNVRIDSDPLGIFDKSLIDASLTDVDRYYVYLNYESKSQLAEELDKISKQVSEIEYNAELLQLEFNGEDLPPTYQIYAYLLIILMTLVIYSSIHYEIKTQSGWLKQFDHMGLPKFKLILLSCKSYLVNILLGTVIGSIIYKIALTLFDIEFLGVISAYTLGILLVSSSVYFIFCIRVFSSKYSSKAITSNDDFKVLILKSVLNMRSFKMMLIISAFMSFITTTSFLYLNHIDFNKVVTSNYVYGEQVIYDVNRSDLLSDQYLETTIKPLTAPGFGEIFFMNTKAFNEVLKLNKLDSVPKSKESIVGYIFTVDSEPKDNEISEIKVNFGRFNHNVQILGYVNEMPFNLGHVYGGYNLVVLDENNSFSVISRVDSLDGSIQLSNVDKYEVVDREEALSKLKKLLQPFWAVFVGGIIIISIGIVFATFGSISYDITNLLQKYRALYLIGVGGKLNSLILSIIYISYTLSIILGAVISYLILNYLNIPLRSINVFLVPIIPILLAVVINSYYTFILKVKERGIL